MKLHTNKEIFKDAIAFTAQKMNLPEIYVEKDYWVTLALYQIYSSSIADRVIFKGGTALSKCFKLIQRFSEGIDLVLLKDGSESGNQLKSILKEVSQTIISELPEIEMPGITNKKGMIRKTAHSFSQEFDGDFGQVRNAIIVEATWLGSFEPYKPISISSFVFEMMKETGQDELAKEYNLYPFEVLVLDPKRTLCEKIMSLVRFSHTENPITDLRNKIRHTYDIHLLLSDKNLHEFFYSKDFETLFLKVAEADVESFKNNNNWLEHHPNEALIFKDTKGVWQELSETYNGIFKELVFGPLPDESEVIERLIEVSKRLEDIEWTIDPNSESN